MEIWLLFLIIIDEVSMADPGSLLKIDEVLRKATGTNAPFGGLGVLLVRDMFQLPPVKPREGGRTSTVLVLGPLDTSRF